MKKQAQDIARNRKALHDYEVLETYEAGIALTGTEVRCCAITIASSPIASRSFATARCGCMASTSPVRLRQHRQPDPDRERKLLLHKTRSANLSSRPRRRHGACPVEDVLQQKLAGEGRAGGVRGKKNYDKRAAMAERDSKREIERALKERSRR
mgnify:CR=1 FL=1